MTGLTSTDKRKRALRIRELAIGFNDETSRTMIGLAEELEAEAAREEAARVEAGDADTRSPLA